MCRLSHCRIRLFVTPWTVAHQAPLSMGFSRQEYWSGLPCPLPGDLPNPGVEPRSAALAGKFFTSDGPLRCRIAFLSHDRLQSYGQAMQTGSHFHPKLQSFFRLQPLPTVSPEETQGVKVQDTGPRLLRCTSKE